MTERATSRNGISIRLTDERWSHIVEEHAELRALRSEVLRGVSEPDRVVMGSSGEFLAVRMVEADRALVVVYKETADDGFVITAFLTTRLAAIARREQVWPPLN